MVIIKGEKIIVEPRMIRLSADVIWFYYGEKSNYCIPYQTESEASEDYEEIKQAIKGECAWLDLDVALENRSVINEIIAKKQEGHDE